MHFTKHITGFLLPAIFIMILGCSGYQTPVTSDFTAESFDTIPVIDLTSNDETFNATGLLGAYNLYVPQDHENAELIPMRTPSVGESFIVSGIGFFTISPCSDCLRINSIELNPDSKIVITFFIKHPFQPGDPLKPPSAFNRLDLDIFDTVLVIAPRRGETPSDYPLTSAAAYTAFCSDTDGYTTELTNVIDDPAALPYFLVIDNSTDGISTWNEFEMGAEAEFATEFDLSEGEHIFDMYLTMGYGASARKLMRLDPRYFNPEFNRKAAWKVNVIPPEGDNPPVIGNTWNDADNTTPFDVTIEVYDWQQGATVWDGVNPPSFEDADQDNVYASSEVSSVSVEIPGMNNTLQSTSTSSGGAGTPDDPLIYTLPIANENSLPVGEYASLVKVTDTRVPASDWLIEGRDYLIDSPDGITISNYNIPEYATYQVFTATVVYGCGPITGQVDSPSCPVSSIGSGETIDFAVSATSDMGGGAVILYEIDYDYDFITFDVDDSNTDGIFEDTGPFVNPDCPADPVPPVTYTVAFRGTDECSPPNITVFATCEVTVDTCYTPVGNVKIEVNYLAHTWMEQGYYSGWRNPIDTENPWTLSWDASFGAESYAIYYDNFPDDGLTNNLVYVDETTELTFTPPDYHLVPNHMVPGTTYIVKARTTLGDPTSELADSEPAFVMVNGWETMSSGQIPGDGNDGEGWLANCQTPWYGPYDRFPCVYSAQFAHGTKTCRPYGPYTGWEGVNEPGHWSGITKETPDVSDSTVRFIGFNGSTWVGWSNLETTPRPGGVIIGTCSTHPGAGWDDPTEFEWAQAADHGDYQPYVDDVYYVETIFDDVATTGNNCWNWYAHGTDPWHSSPTPTDHLFGGDVNNGGNPDDDYIGIVACRETTGNGTFFYIDEVSVCIY